jgi:hypothetical protein
VLFQVRENGPYRSLVTVFASWLSFDKYSEVNAELIKQLVIERTGGLVDVIRLDPAATAKTGVGPSAFDSYQNVLGWSVAFWPQHQVQDGIDQIQMLLGEPGREPDLIIHPRAVELIQAFNGYVWAFRNGQWQSSVQNPCHPHEDLLDCLRGGIRDAIPVGRAMGGASIGTAGPTYAGLYDRVNRGDYR